MRLDYTARALPGPTIILVSIVAPALAVDHADRALALEDQPRRIRSRAHGQIRPLHRRMQECARRADAAAFQDRPLRIVDAELAFAVVVRVARDAEAHG